MRQFKKLCLIILSVIIVCCSAGCGNSDSSAIIYFALDNKPDTLDPQLASTEQELLIVHNIFEGLLRENENGETAVGAADSYHKDGLVYTFKLRDDILWSTGDKLTAEDFLFAFKRAVNPETKAPFVNRLFSIKNAENIYYKKADLSSLGVEATDSTTLKITLCREDPNFEKTLTTSIAMPCNEEFFNSCKGQYGIKSQYVISNGSYRLTKWNREDFAMRIYKNSKYNGNYKALNGAVFFSSDKDLSPAERLSANKADLAFIKNADILKFNSDGFTVNSFENICWFLSLGDDYNNNLRKAFMLLCSSSIYKDKLSYGFRAADSIYPAILAAPDTCSDAGFVGYDSQTAVSLFSKEVAGLPDKKLPPTTLTYYDNASMKPVVTAIVGHWQQMLSAFINISGYTQNESLVSELYNHSLPMSVFCVKTNSGYINEYLENFGIHYTGENLADIQISILKSNHIVPLAFENTNIVYSNNLSGVSISNTGLCIDFSFVKKAD